MDWTNERYVRLYIRDTIEWTLMPWQSKALFPLILRKADRSGVIDLGKHGVAGLSALTGLPVEVAAEGLEGLTACGAIEQAGTAIVVPNFIEAQEVTATDAQRAREYRSRRRDEARAGARPVTPRHTVTDDVTPRDAVTDTVTPSRDASQRHVTHHGITDTVTPSVPNQPNQPNQNESESACAREATVELSLDAPLADDARMVWDTIAMSTGSLGAVDIAAAWAAFCGHRATVAAPLVSRRAVLGAWQKWASTQAVYAKRDRMRDAERDAAGLARAGTRSGGRIKQPGGSTVGWNPVIEAQPGDEPWDGTLTGTGGAS
jgi:hypothetical protein